MNVEVWVCWLGFFILSVLVFLILYLNRRVSTLELESEVYRKYLSVLISKHNLVSTEVASISSSFSSLINSNLQVTDQLNQIYLRLGDLDVQVDYIMGCWQNEWGSGESWKDGFRPDGSELDDEE